jgi:hypothetical protein
MNSSKQRGFGRTYQRGKIAKIWWIQYSVNGKRYRESSKSENRADAVRLLKKRHTAIAQGKPVGARVEKTTLGDLSQMLLDHYRANGRKSVIRAQFAFKWLCQYFGAEAGEHDHTGSRDEIYRPPTGAGTRECHDQFRTRDAAEITQSRVRRGQSRERAARQKSACR